MSRTAWIVFIVLIVGVLGGLIFLSRSEQLNVDDVDTFQIQAASADNGNIGDHVIGEADAPVQIIEYGDYQCPGCSVAAPTIKEVAEEYKDKGVMLVLRNFPLVSIHPNALAAASAAEAAGLQGKFWEMHDQLYATQSTWEGLSGEQRTDVFAGYAESLGLDIEQFNTDVTSNAVAQKIDFDIALGRKKGITGTPSIYVNGENYSSSRVVDGKLSSDTSGSYVWADKDDFINLVIKPALEKAGVTVEE